MSQKPFDIDRAIAGLKEVRPERVPRADQLRTQRKRPPTRLIAVGLTAIGAGVLFWPRVGGGSIAWAQVVENTQQTQRFYVRTTMGGKGSFTSEQWVDGPRYAYKIMWPTSKQTVSYTVFDGNYLTYSRGYGKGKNGSTDSIAYRAKTKPTSHFLSIGLLGSESNFIDDILKNQSFKVLEQKEVDTPKGKRMRYDVRRQHAPGKPNNGYEMRMTFFADPTSKLIVRAETYVGNSGQNGKPLQIATVAEIEYPESMSDEVFKFKMPGVKVVDLDKLRANVADTIKKGLGSQTVKGQKVTLRSVLYDHSGGLWVLWSGSGLPRGDLAYPIRVAGLPVPRRTKFTYPAPKSARVINVFGLKGLTANATESNRRSVVLPSINARLGGMAMGVPNQTFKTINVVVPVLDSTGSKKLGEATFRNVPVQRIGSIYEFRSELGI